MTRKNVFTTSAVVTAGTHIIEVGQDAAITIEATGLTGVQTVQLHIPNNTSYEQDFVNGVALELSPLNKSMRIFGPKLITPVKSDTGASVVTLTKIY